MDFGCVSLHGVVLAACSPFIASLLTENNRNSPRDENVLFLPDCEKEDFVALVKVKINVKLVCYCYMFGRNTKFDVTRPFYISRFSTVTIIHAKVKTRGNAIVQVLGHDGPQVIVQSKILLILTVKISLQNI